MAYRYVCSAAGFKCETVIVDEEEERTRKAAEEHLRTEHPHEALEQNKAAGLIIGGMKPA